MFQPPLLLIISLCFWLIISVLTFNVNIHRILSVIKSIHFHYSSRSIHETKVAGVLNSIFRHYFASMLRRKTFKSNYWYWVFSKSEQEKLFFQSITGHALGFKVVRINIVNMQSMWNILLGNICKVPISMIRKRVHAIFPSKGIIQIDNI